MYIIDFHVFVCVVELLVTCELIVDNRLIDRVKLLKNFLVEEGGEFQNLFILLHLQNYAPILCPLL